MASEKKDLDIEIKLLNFDYLEKINPEQFTPISKNNNLLLVYYTNLECSSCVLELEFLKEIMQDSNQDFELMVLGYADDITSAKYVLSEQDPLGFPVYWDKGNNFSKLNSEVDYLEKNIFVINSGKKVIGIINPSEVNYNKKYVIKQLNRYNQ